MVHLLLWVVGSLVTLWVAVMVVFIIWAIILDVTVAPLLLPAVIRELWNKSLISLGGLWLHREDFWYVKLPILCVIYALVILTILR